jgi:hypothetical protein
MHGVGVGRTRQYILDRETQIRWEHRGQEGIDLYSRVTVFGSQTPTGERVYWPWRTQVLPITTPTGASPPASFVQEGGRGNVLYDRIRGPLLRNGRMEMVPLEIFR